MKRILRKFLLIILINNVYFEGFSVEAWSSLPPLPPLPFLSEFEYGISTINYFGAIISGVDSTVGIQDVRNDIQELSEKVEAMESRISDQIETTSKAIINRLKVSGNLDHSMRKLAKYIIDIDNLFFQFFHYADVRNQFNNETIKSFAETIVSFSPKHLFDLLNKIHKLILPDRTADMHESLLNSIQKELLTKKDELCGGGLSSQQRLFDFYKSIILTELRGYLTASSAYKTLSILKKTPFKNEILKVAKDFEKRRIEYAFVMKMILQTTSRFIHSCDPKVPEQDDTFIRLTGMYSPYIINQYDIDIPSSKRNGSEIDDKLDLCRTECSTFTVYEEKKNCSSQFCNDEQHRCHGEIIDCISGGKAMEICLNDEPVYQRYRWFKELWQARLYGDDSAGCADGQKRIIRQKSSIFKQAQPRNCDNCICTCSIKDTNENIFNRISLAPQTSDISDKKVITGVKFERNGEMIYLKIKEGKLLANGKISSNFWKSTDPVVFNETYSQFQYQETDKFLKINKDFLVVHSSEYNFLDLDDLILPENYLLTGVRIKRFKNHHFGLALRGTLFNFTTGDLMVAKSLWVDLSSKHDDENREELILESPTNPLGADHNTIISLGMQTIKFQMSDLRNTVGEFIVPFLDSQKVETEPPFPLAGIGLIFKGKSGYGGFIAPRLITYDVANLL